MMRDSENLFRSLEAVTTMRWKVTSQLLRAFSGALPGQKPGKVHVGCCGRGMGNASIQVHQSILTDLKDLASGRDLLKVADV